MLGQNLNYLPAVYRQQYKKESRKSNVVYQHSGQKTDHYYMAQIKTILTQSLTLYIVLKAIIKCMKGLRKSWNKRILSWSK